MLNKVTIAEGNSTSFDTALKTYIDQAIDHFKHELTGIRTGRAHTAMIEDIKVVCYGGTSEMRLKELAALAAPDVNMLIIEPWDKSIIPDIEKAISKSDLGINPINDGNIIRLQLPVMSAQRREELAKILHKKLEESRIAIRAVRRDFHNFLRDKEHEKAISQDFSKRMTDKLQKAINQGIGTVEECAKKKEQEIKSV